MPIFILSIKCELENIKQIKGIEHNLWKLNIKSTDNSDNRQGITVSDNEIIELDGSKGIANFVIKWSKGSSQSYIKLVNLKNIHCNYNENDSNKWKPILGFECRGIEIDSWIPGYDFTVETSGGYIFNSVNLEEKEWAEYDEENDLSISIMNLESKIDKQNSNSTFE